LLLKTAYAAIYWAKTNLAVMCLEAVLSNFLEAEHCNLVMEAERDDTSDTRQVTV
jgi:hypothetical protein